MKIKLQTPRGLVKRNKPSRNYHWWLDDEQPKKSGRLSQLSRKNSRLAANNHTLRVAEGSAEREGRES